MTRLIVFLLSCLTLDLPVGACQARHWELVLKTPGGDLPVGLDLETRDEKLSAWLVNGRERIAVDSRKENEQIVLDFPHYDSRIVLQQNVLDYSGEWTKRRGPMEIAKVPCHIQIRSEKAWQDPESYLGRWSVEFSDSVDQAVGVFERFGENEIIGTFLTTIGDYRYLHGGVQSGELVLSCFDGAHAFLFKAKLTASGELKGKFFSGNWYEETWTAKKDSTAKLPDAFGQSVVAGAERLGQLEFPDVDGKLRKLSDPSFKSRLLLIEVFGTWCPNCHDEATYLKELREKYGKRGLQVLGLAFEMTGDFQRDSKQVKRYRERFDIDYPILIAGTSDKVEASKRFPVLDQIRSYPTTLFVDSTGTIRAVYTGFSGPATGEAHLELRKSFESIIERVLDDQ